MGPSCRKSSQTFPSNFAWYVAFTLENPSEAFGPPPIAQSPLRTFDIESFHPVDSPSSVGPSEGEPVLTDDDVAPR